MMTLNLRFSRTELLPPRIGLSPSELLMDLSKADKPPTFTSIASFHDDQDTEEMTVPSQLPSTITEAPMQPFRGQTAPIRTRSGRVVKSPDRLNLYTNMFDFIRPI